MLADAHISSLGYLWRLCDFWHEINVLLRSKVLLNI